MTWLIPLLVLLLAVPVSIVIKRERTQRRHALARALGLGYQEGGFGHSERMIGTRRGLAVSIQWISRNQGRQRRTYTRWIVGGASPSLTLRPQGIGNELLRRVSGGEDLIVGDPEFDREVIVSGPPALVSALLDHHARRKILALPDGAALGSGNLTWDTRGEPGEPEVVAYTLDHAVELMERLADPGPALVERLAGVAATDLEPGVRRRALRALAGVDPAAAAGAARELEGDPDPAVRLQGALVTGDVDALAKAPDHALLAVASESPDPVARALVRVRSERGLLALLTSDETSVRVSAARGLARIGTTRAVEPLQVIAKALLVGDELRSAARSALESIQARAESGGAGRVSLAEEGGQVSVADEAGRLSVARKTRS